MDKLLNDFSPGLFIMQTVLLIIIILLMRKFAWKPILNTLDEREKGIEDAINTAEQARKEIAALEAKNDNLVKEARIERDNMIKEAKETSDQMIEAAKNKAQEEAEKVMANAQAAIVTERNAAFHELKGQVASMALEIAEKVIREEMKNDDKQKAIASKLAEEISLN